MSGEQYIERDLVRRAKLAGLRAVKFVDPSQRGAPDRVILAPGGHVSFVELKTETGKISTHQRRYHEELRAMGFVVSVSRSTDDNQSIIQMIVDGDDT